LRRPILALALLAASTAASCFDPVHADDVAALGPEADGVRTGETHRPGQPCFVCHGGAGPGPEFAFAGTVYLTKDGAEPARGAQVELRQGSDPSKSYRVRTNEVGNFYVEKNRFDPVYPVFVALVDGRITEGTPGRRDMISSIGRDGGCGYCHVRDVAAAGAMLRMPQVYLNAAAGAP
jgi:hypothetical protein